MAERNGQFIKWSTSYETSYLLMERTWKLLVCTDYRLSVLALIFIEVHWRFSGTRYIEETLRGFNNWPADHLAELETNDVTFIHWLTGRYGSCWILDCPSLDTTSVTNLPPSHFFFVHYISCHSTLFTQLFGDVVNWTRTLWLGLQTRHPSPAFCFCR